MSGKKGEAKILGYSIGINGENQIQLIETAGRTCYKSHDKITDDSAVRFVKKLRDIGHESVIEHSWVAVRFTGCSRAFTHQLVRHRLMAISQESQRYCDEQIDDWYQELQVKLKEAIKAGKTRGKVNEDARFILPNAVCSEIVISCNFREWRHIFKMRTDIYAQWEIRYVMVDLLRQFQKLFPVVFDDFEISDDGRSAGKITK